MGFSVSGSAAIVLVGLFISAGVLLPAVSNGAERLHDARSEATDRRLEQRNAGLAVANATHYASNDTVVLKANNTGTSGLTVEAADVLADGDYVTPTATEVDGDGDTGLWLPGETLRVEFDATAAPDRVVVVADHGVSDATEEVA